MWGHPPAQGEIDRVGSASIRGRGVTGATATAQRTEMRGDDIHMICTYGHREICGKMGDQSRVGAVVRFDSRIGIVEPFDSRDSGVRELEIVGRLDSRESRVKESGSGSEG